MRLHLYAPENGLRAAETPVAWVLQDRQGAFLRQGCDRPEEIPKAEIVELILPAGALLLTTVRLPGRRAPAAQALAFALEEQLLTEPENTHVVVLRRFPDGLYAVAALDRIWLEDTLRALAAAGLSPQKARPETLLVPWVEGSWSLVWDGSHGFVRTGAYAGFALDGDASGAPLPLRLALAEGRRQGGLPARIVFYLGESTHLPGWAADLGVETVQAPPWRWQHAALRDDGSNLLQGPFTVSTGAPPWLRELRPAAVVLGLIGLLHLGAGVTDWARLEREQAALRAEMNGLFLQAFPEARVVVDAPLQMRRNLEDLRRLHGALAGDDFLSLLADAAGVLTGAGELQALDYQRGRLVADLRLRADTTPAAVLARLAGAGLAASFTAADGVTRFSLGRAP